jgi:hypothetical protein
LITYVTLCRPYFNDRDNYLEIFNESTICILFLIPMCALVVDESILDGPARHDLGYVLIGILLLNLVINYLLFFFDIVFSLITKVKAMIKKCKEKNKMAKSKFNKLKNSLKKSKINLKIKEKKNQWNKWLDKFRKNDTKNTKNSTTKVTNH